MSLLNDLQNHTISAGRRLTGLARGLHRCERGDIPIGQIVMIALVVIPLLLVLFFFRNEATVMITSWWSKLTGGSAGCNTAGGSGC